MAQTEGTDALLTKLGADAYYNATDGASKAKVFTDAQLTDSNGDATFNIPPGYFTKLHAGFVTVGRATTTIGAASAAYIRSSSTTQVIARGFESKNTGVLIGGNVEGAEFVGAGITINLVMFGV